MKIISPRYLLTNAKPGDVLIRTKPVNNQTMTDYSFMRRGEGWNYEDNPITIIEITEEKIYFKHRYSQRQSFRKKSLEIGWFLDGWEKYKEKL